MKALTVAALAALLAASAGCQTTRFHQRGRLVDRCMQLDADGALNFVRLKAQGAREGSFGGYGGGAAGGCGCE